jgi:hypothetical protein
MKTWTTALAAVLLAISCAPALAGGANPAADLVVGRVTVVDPRAGTVIVEFPSGPMRLNPDQRDLDRFVFYQGKELVFDQAMRPQWNTPVPSVREPARPR